jgi:hypothetical protein
MTALKLAAALVILFLVGWLFYRMAHELAWWTFSTTYAVITVSGIAVGVYSTMSRKERRADKERAGQAAR